MPIKANVWYLGNLKTLAIKRWFQFNFANILQGCCFVVGALKNFTISPDISIDSGFEKIVL